MNRAEIISKLKAVEPQLRAHGVAALYLFGSYARDEARPDSDVDVFVDPANEDAFGLIPLFNSRAVVENTLAGMEIAYSTLRHEYYRINARDMWEIVKVHLPELRPVIVKMLEDLNGGSSTE
jgi:predicted nucleotidyltransferase